MKKRWYIVLSVLLLGAPALSFASDFDWSQSWCNYGAGIEKGDWLLTVDGGVSETLFSGSGYWGIPYAEVSVKIAQPIWRLPFTFGGYVGVDAYGYKKTDYSDAWSQVRIHFGGEAQYHVMFPPKHLDLYAGTRLGAVIYAGHNSGFHLDGAGILGANYFFTDHFAVNAELGAPVWLKVGVTFAF